MKTNIVPERFDHFTYTQLAKYSKVEAEAYRARLVPDAGKPVEEPKEDAELIAHRAALAAAGVKHHPKAGLERLKELAAENNITL
jgi:hypothetical protein